MTRKELYYFAGGCLSLDKRPEKRDLIIERIQKNEVNWEQFVQLCSNHLILQVIYIKFRAHDLLRYLPNDLTEYLENVYQLNRIRNIRILKQVEEITSALNKEGINPVFLKGTANLLDNVYTDPGERIIGDIDLLVPEKDFLKAAKIVEGMGYLKDQWPDYFPVTSYKHYPRLWRKDVPADIEIHRLPLPDKYLRWLNPEMIFNNKVPVPKYTGAYVPSDKHKIIHSIINGQWADARYYNGTISFRDLYDLYLYSDTTEIAPLINGLPSARKAINYLTLSEKILGLPGKIYPERTMASQLHIFRHDLNLASAMYYHSDHFIRKLLRLIYKSYIIKFFRLFSSAAVRKEIARKLKDPNWYRIHFKRYADLAR